MTTLEITAANFKQDLGLLQDALTVGKKWIGTSKGRIYVKKKWSKFVRFFLCIFDKLSGGKIFCKYRSNTVGKALFHHSCATIERNEWDDTTRDTVLALLDTLKGRVKKVKTKQSIEDWKEKIRNIKFENCTICFCPVLQAPDYVFEDTRVLDCSHFFHEACIQEWENRGHNDCPNCRGMIDPNQPNQARTPDTMTPEEVRAAAGGGEAPFMGRQEEGMFVWTHDMVQAARQVFGPRGPLDMPNDIYLPPAWRLISHRLGRDHLIRILTASRNRYNLEFRSNPSANPEITARNQQAMEAYNSPYNNSGAPSEQVLKA